MNVDTPPPFYNNEIEFRYNALSNVAIFHGDRTELVRSTMPKWDVDKRIDMSHLNRELMNKAGRLGNGEKSHVALYIKQLPKPGVIETYECIKERQKDGKKFIFVMTLNSFPGVVLHYGDPNNNTYVLDRNEKNDVGLDISYDMLGYAWESAYTSTDVRFSYLDIHHLIPDEMKMIVSLYIQDMQNFKFDFHCRVSNSLTLQVIGYAYDQSEIPWSVNDYVYTLRRKIPG